MFTVNPYLHFTGNTEAAFVFYRSIFGGEFITLARYADMPSQENCDQPMSADDQQKIMHVSLMIGNGTMLMGSDVLESSPFKIESGNNFSISLNPDDPAEAKRLFEGLSQDGTVTMPFGEAFWGSLFGSCVDRFGISWMINYALPSKT